MDITFHYPPELLQLLIDAIPKLCKSKRDLLLFFQGAGVSKAVLQSHTDLLVKNKESFNKYHVARDVLARINEHGESGLRVRREILKRVTEFEDFTVCWDNDRAAARGLVAQIRDVVNVKDSFTRMRIEKDEEKRKWQQARDSEVKTRADFLARRDQIKAALFALFGEPDAHKRGKALEKVLNDLFDCYGISIRESFTIKGKCAEGIIEQIDGLIELEGHLYLVEMKWWNTSIGVAEVSPHLVRVFNRGGQVRGVFISYSDFTAPAITQCRDALARGTVIVMATLRELVELLGSETDLRKWLTSKIRSAIVDKEPYRAS